LNGDSQLIYDAVKSNGANIAKIYTRLESVQITQKLQHKENAKDIEEIKEDLKSTRNHSGQIKAQWILLGLMLAWLVKLSLSI